ncbi:MAG: helix-turn-helix domain-containing protein [Proteobacteria bacterium]|nr:helix-turn-helix domain-containing protein [Pseudomonadota bacterium]
MCDNEKEQVNPDSLLTPDEVARRLTVSVFTLARWRKDGFGPPFVKLGKGHSSLIRYRYSDLCTFIENCEKAIAERT